MENQIEWHKLKANGQILENYKISKCGKIKRDAGKILNGRFYTYKEDKIIKQSNANGYKIVTIIINKKKKQIYVHRLLAETFLENKNNYKCVNHIDGNKSNNSLYNLEWCTYSENEKHAYKNGLKTSLKGELSHFYGKTALNAKKLICTKTGLKFDTIKSASEYVNIGPTYLAKCLRGERPNRTTLIYYNEK